MCLENVHFFLWCKTNKLAASSLALFRFTCSSLTVFSLWGFIGSVGQFPLLRLAAGISLVLVLQHWISHEIFVSISKFVYFVPYFHLANSANGCFRISFIMNVFWSWGFSVFSFLPTRCVLVVIDCMAQSSLIKVFKFFSRSIGGQVWNCRCTLRVARISDSYTRRSYCYKGL